MQIDESVIEFSFEPFQLDPNTEHTLSEVQYSQNYVDILGDLIESFPLHVPSIEMPYDETQDEKAKIQATYKRLKRVKHRKNRKQLLLMFFLLGQLLDETSLSTRELFNLNAVLVMGWDNVHGRDVQDCPVHEHELCNVQDMSRTFYI